jgi:hypothetical protein
LGYPLRSLALHTQLPEFLIFPLPTGDINYSAAAASR